MKIQSRSKREHHVTTKHNLSWSATSLKVFTPLVIGVWKWVGVALLLNIFKISFGFFAIAFLCGSKNIKNKLTEEIKSIDKHSQELPQIDKYTFSLMDFEKDTETEKREG